ncbi:sortase [Georgenia sp. 10Sc9-8]|uniref:Sortase n=1 Tax=Georgenia halotolerans TaxID=3028317 RepID=A0ABT5TYE3_9MICO|nr:sortase [Georgenia halotolerans]
MTAAGRAGIAGALLLLGLAGCADDADDGAPTEARTSDAVAAPEAEAPAPEADAEPDATAGPEIPVPEAPAGEGAAVGSLQVPRWGADYDMPISEGVSDHVLDTLGMGRFPRAQLPGEEGNFAVSGHRTDGSRPLARIDELELGDELVVSTDVGTYTYVVSDTEIVTPDEIRVVEPNPYDPDAEPVGRLMTLVTCHPWDSSEFRYIVHAELEDFAAA